MRLRENIYNQHLASQQSVSDVSKYSHSSLGSIVEHSDSEDFEDDEPPKLNYEESKE
jgi:hypothetical protein